MITVKDVNLKIKKDMILRDINVEFNDGRIHGIIGRNGSGKTMLMKCICGLIRPTEGEITVAGKRIGIDCDFPESVGVIIETPEFIPYYSGFKNLKLLADIRHKISNDDICRSIELVGLDPNLKKSVKKYSLGMRQRLGLARALYRNPSLIVFDEATSALDLETEAEIMNSISRLKGTRTLVIVSHRKSTISGCDRIYRVEDGKAVRER